jgi:hypothetical protein
MEMLVAAAHLPPLYCTGPDTKTPAALPAFYELGKVIRCEAARDFKIPLSLRGMLRRQKAAENSAALLYLLDTGLGPAQGISCGFWRSSRDAMLGARRAAVRALQGAGNAAVRPLRPAKMCNLSLRGSLVQLMASLTHTPEPGMVSRYHLCFFCGKLSNLFLSRSTSAGFSSISYSSL